MPTSPESHRTTDRWTQASGRPGGPSWLVVQIMAAAMGLLLVAAVLLPLAMGLRLRGSEAAARERAERIGVLTEELETLRRRNHREGDGSADATRIRALEAERDRLEAELQALAATPSETAASPGPALESPASTPPPLAELLRNAGSISFAVAGIGAEAVDFGLSDGALGFAMQQRVVGLFQGVVLRPDAPTRIVATVELWEDSQRPDHGILTLTLHLEQPWRLDGDRVATVILWTRSFARETIAGDIQVDSEQVLSYLIDLLARDVGSP